MNEGETIQPQNVLPARVESQLADLAEARGVAVRFLRRIDNVAEAMTPEEQVKALAANGQMVLNVTRMDRALRQIVVLEQEVMGLRAPPVPHGPGSGGSSGDGRARHDFNDLNDLNEPDDLNDLKDTFEELFDLDNPADRQAYEDLDALESCNSFKTYNKKCSSDRRFSIQTEQGLEARLKAGLDKIAAARAEAGGPPPPMRTEEETMALLESVAAEFPPDLFLRAMSAEELWRARREALLNLRAAEKRLKRAGRGPPRG